MPNSETQRILGQLRAAYEGEPWVGASLQMILGKVAPSEVHARPVEHRHTIHELLFHIIANRRMVIRRLQGDPAPFVEEESWPDATTDRVPWSELLSELTQTQRELERLIAELDDDALDTVLPYGNQTHYQTLHGLIQHDYYHGGQMMMLRRA